MARHGSALYGTLARYYDRIYAFKDYRAETQELIRIARKYLRRPGESLLDVGCGTGTHLLDFRRVFQVAGLDLSPAMLRVARSRLGPRVPLFRGDMRTFELGRRFDVVACLFSSIGYLTKAVDRRRTFANFYRHLRPGGIALIEGWVLPSRWKGQSMQMIASDGADAKVVRVARSWRRGRFSEIEMQYLVAEPGRPIRHYVDRHRNLLASADDTLRLLRSVGFEGFVLLSGRWQDRGLFVGAKPLAAS